MVKREPRDPSKDDESINAVQLQCSAVRCGAEQCRGSCPGTEENGVWYQGTPHKRTLGHLPKENNKHSCTGTYLIGSPRKLDES